MSGDKTIRVLIVDDHEMVRNGLATFLNVHKDIEVGGTASSGEEALHFCEHNPVDVVLMDLVMGELDGVAATRVLHDQCPDVKVIALTSFGEAERISAAFQAGAAGYLMKDISGDDLADAIRQAAAGDVAVTPDITKALVETVIHPSGSLNTDLSWRERQILQLLAAGLTNNQIAAQLSIKPSTVKTYNNRIFSKLGVSSRVEAAMFAVKHHLVEQ